MTLRTGAEVLCRTSLGQLQGRNQHLTGFLRVRFGLGRVSLEQSFQLNSDNCKRPAKHSKPKEKKTLS